MPCLYGLLSNYNDGAGRWKATGKFSLGRVDALLRLGPITTMNLVQLLQCK